MTVAMQPSIKDLKQLGWCEVCGNPAYSSRWDEQLILETVDGKLVHKATVPVEHRICMRHKAHYFAHMKRKQEELEKKTNGASAHKGSR